MVKYKKGTPWLVLTPKMKEFEKETGKSAVYHGKITGQFEFWLWQEEKKSQKPQKKFISSISMSEFYDVEKLGKSDLMIKFEKETGKSAIYRGKITKQFSSWLSEEEHFDYQLSKQKEINNLYIVRRQSIPSVSKTSKYWRFYIKMGKEKIYIASQEGRKDYVHLDGDKTMLRTHLKWRYSISYDYDGILKALNIKRFESKYIKSDYGYYVSNLTDVVVDKMNMLANYYSPKNKFSIPIKRS